MAKLIITIIALICLSQSAIAEVIDVNIKGIDDGRKSNRQQDFREAVLDAKLHAIEQAGASIESITKVVNFQLKYDAVESKSKAILLPGFQIIDIGYVTDGTYQVVLVGKIQTTQVVGKRPSISKARETERDGRFIAYDNGTVLDTRTRLMWAATDNGSNIDYAEAKSYCENYRAGGYTDWRMPTDRELLGLFDSTKTYESDCGYKVHLTELIHLTCIAPWAYVPDGSRSVVFHTYGDEGTQSLSQVMEVAYRALPVRSVK